ncbi:MAG: hypothetical protein ABJD07_12110 [Gemmatimonadaceae bacterium]
MFARLVGDALTVPDTASDMRGGSIRPTSSPTDLALDGPGFFVLDSPNGERLRRGGTFRVVDGNTSSELAISATDPGALVIKGQAEQLRDIGGTLGATTDALRTTIPGHQATLDTLASTIVTTVNGLHATGWTAAAGGTGTNFFDPAGTTAATIDLSAQVKANAQVIAAGTTVNGAGDNSLALALAGLRRK